MNCLIVLSPALIHLFPLFPSLLIYACPLSSPKMRINTNGDKAQIHRGMEREREGERRKEEWREAVDRSSWWDRKQDTMIDWANTKENRGKRTGGWGMVGGWRRRGEINMALIVSSAPLLSLNQSFITPLQSVQRWHFGKWGPPLTPSFWNSSNICRCASNGSCVWMFKWSERLCDTKRWWCFCLQMSLSPISTGVKKKSKLIFHSLLIWGNTINQLW